MKVSFRARRLRVALLFRRYRSPETVDGLEVIGQVEDAIHQLGHDIRLIGVTNDLQPLRAVVDEWKPQVVFNLLVSFRDVEAFDGHIGAYLELLDMPYTGCNPRGTLLARDKALGKAILSHHGISTPPFSVVSKSNIARLPSHMRYPLIVKAARGWGSEGVAQASLVRNSHQLQRRVQFVHQRVGTDALIEKYIAGRELTIGVIGNIRLQTFPVWEMYFGNLPRGSLPFQTESVKWDRAYRERVGITNGRAHPLDSHVERRIERTAKNVYRRLRLSGYARIDMRLTDDGRIFVLEANPYPGLRADGRFVCSAAAAGLPYPDLIQRLLTIGMRYRPPWATAHRRSGSGPYGARNPS